MSHRFLNRFHAGYYRLHEINPPEEKSPFQKVGSFDFFQVHGFSTVNKWRKYLVTFEGEKWNNHYEGDNLLQLLDSHMLVFYDNYW